MIKTMPSSDLRIISTFEPYKTLNSTNIQIIMKEYEIHRAQEECIIMATICISCSIILVSYFYILLPAFGAPLLLDIVVQR